VHTFVNAVIATCVKTPIEAVRCTLTHGHPGDAGAIAQRKLNVAQLHDP
jgi:hypothetical protein